MALTIEEFGARVKQRYPEYNDLSDRDLGERVLRKYPEYRDMVNEADTRPSSSVDVFEPGSSAAGSEKPFHPITELYKQYGRAFNELGGTKPIKAGLEGLGVNTDWLPETPGFGEMVGYGAKALGNVIGGAVGGLGGLTRNVLQGRDNVLEDVGSDIIDSAKKTGNFMQQIGEAGVPAATLGAYGPAVTIPLGVNQAREGIEEIGEGMSENDPEKLVRGAISFGTGTLGLYHGARAIPGVFRGRGEGLFLNPEAKATAERVLPESKYILEPYQNVVKPAIRAIPGVGSLVRTGEQIGKGLTGVSEQAQTILKEEGTSQEDIERYMRAAKEAAKNPRKNTPLELASEHVEDAFDWYQKKLNEYGAQKSAIIREPDVANTPFQGLGEIKQDLNAEIIDRFGFQPTYNRGSGEWELSPVRGRVGNLPAADQRLLLSLWNRVNDLPSNEVSLREVDDTVDLLQAELWGAKGNLYQSVNNRVEGLFKKVTGSLGSALNEQASPEFANANAYYSYYKDMRDWLNHALGSEGTKGGALMKRIFSPSDAGTKAAFEQIRQDTGIDLVKEATLAKLAMDTTGDARSQSLLQQMNLLAPKTSLTRAAFEMLRRWLFSPERAIKKMTEPETPTRNQPMPGSSTTFPPLVPTPRHHQLDAVDEHRR